MLNKIYNRESKEGLEIINENTVHSIVTDPPYELGIMGKNWDKSGIAYDVDFWKQCFRVLRPGGFLLAFSSCRTYHRVACAIEDAGFVIRDKIDYFYDANEAIIKFWNSLSEEQKRAFEEIINKDTAPGFMSWIHGQGFPKGLNIGKHLKRLTEKGILDKEICEVSDWDGWGTLLKPANEPICIAQKPISEKTILENILKWGTGAFNIDSNRIGIEVIKTSGKRSGQGNVLSLKDYKSPKDFKGESRKGRHPANVILDSYAGDLLDKQTGILKSGSNCIRTKPGTFLENGGLGKKGDVQITYGDKGGASRFFYCAKATGKKDRDDYNNHPTLKPLKLIKHLVSLCTLVGGVSLDPFSGSGTHSIACLELGINYIGFEKERDYYEINNRRIKEYKEQISLNNENKLEKHG